MRSGGCAVQQTLTTEAASVLKHSLSLARRRGHAQVTPLHVAATLLSSRTSLLRRACLKSQPHQSSHPLQCRALELCFNVALNRLPTTPGPLLHGQPSLSNALIAALKRAQAHQRRGCIEQQQQQPLLTIKVELEQLIISILDDPSVSRVMREAGFSSTAVKNHIEDSSASSVFQCYSTSGGVFSSPCSPSPSDTQRDHHQIINPNAFWQTHFLTYSSEQNPLLFSPQKKVSTLYTVPDSANSVNKEDIKLVFEVLLRKKRRNTVIVGDCFSATEGLVLELMGRVERGDVPDELKRTHFIKFQFAPVTLRFMKKEDVEMNLTELKRNVDALISAGGGAIIYTGDLKWTVDQENLSGEISCYSPVNHLVAEIGRLVSDLNSSNSKVWLVATASYQTYRRCQMKQPPLEIQWALQAVSVPSGGLGLSLHASSVHDSRLSFSQNPSQVRETKPFTCKEEEDKLTCCTECTSNYENEAQLFKSGQQKLLPPWLQSHTANANQKDELVELKRKWNRLCHSLHQGKHSQSLIGKSYSYASSYPWLPSQSSIFSDSNSISFAESALKPNNSSHSVPKFRRQQSCTIEFDFGNSTHKLQGGEPSLDSLKSSEGKEVKITLALGNSVFSDSGKLEKDENGRAIPPDDFCKALQETVPWQCEIIPSIVDALIESKSTKKETWLLIQGNDAVGKRRLALAIAELVFGSADLLFCINMSKRNNDVIQLSELLIQKLKKHEKLVVLVEDVHLADSKFMKLLAHRFETGKFGESREENSGQIIFILAKGDSSNHEDSVIPMTLKMDGRNPSSDQKRKAEWDFPNKINKSVRIEEKEDASSSIAIDNASSKKDFSRQSSFNTLDLNMKADEEEDDDERSEEKMGELSPISSDLTRDTTTNPTNSNGLLDLIKNRFVLNRNSTNDREIKGVFLSRFKECFEEVFEGEDRVTFSVEDRVIEEVFIGCSTFLNSLFDKWLKEVFKTSLNTVKLGGKGGGVGIRVIRLSFGNVTEVDDDDGFKDSCLPKNIQFSSTMD
ncbi:hypothetical protein ACOSQ2_015928 [Xanthoceras sorbifolium]|uniref:Clp R domain-containing protein n=1 Tax=Xanthoceras sorbifolium TaxID=99658 RepID=A0ABQ8I7C2_9ROSI|nr:hypothetical protein JRO89_XS04G0269100 [Xanthoceras sorbifolium]